MTAVVPPGAQESLGTVYIFVVVDAVVVVTVFGAEALSAVITQRITCVT